MKRKSAPARRQQGPANSPAQQIISTAARWRALSSDMKMRFNLANAAYFTPANPLTPNRSSGYAFFVALAANLETLQAAPPTAPPASLIPPPPLPPMSLSITIGSDFTMNLLPRVAVPAGNYVLSATPAVPVGNTTWNPKAYRKLGVITSGIPLGGLDIADLYRSAYPQPYNSCQLSIKITPIASNGLHNISLFVTGLTPLLTMEVALQDPADTEDNLHVG